MNSFYCIFFYSLCYAGFYKRFYFSIFVYNSILSIMKKLMLSMFVVCMAFGNLQAQEIDLGLKLGANFSKLSDVKGFSSNSQTGFVGGAFLAIKFNKLAIQPEVLYSQQGADFDIGEFNTDYINVPVMFKYDIIGSLINIQAGPQFGFIVNKDFPSLSGVGEQIKTNDFDFSGAVGVGLNLPLGIRVSGRYHFGFTEVTEEMGGKNNYFTIAVGYSFL